MADEFYTAVYAGTFDPPTLGHIDIIRRAASIFGGVTVAVGINVHKKVLFTADERAALLRESLSACVNVRVALYDGLLVDFCRSSGARVMIRGLRDGGDFDYEYRMAMVNRDLAPEIETFFMPALPERAFVSSSAVREIASFGGDVASYVPECVSRAMREKYRS